MLGGRSGCHFGRVGVVSGPELRGPREATRPSRRDDFGDDLIRQLLYTSSTTLADASAANHDILRTSRRRNAAEGLTGYLIKNGSTFIQVLEGEDQAIETAFRRIRRDMRHYGIVARFSRKVARRQFSDWSMGYSTRTVDLSAGPDSVLAQIVEISEEPATLRQTARLTEVQRPDAIEEPDRRRAAGREA